MTEDIGGVWRTIGGRRVFIKEGQDLASAMKESGKFKKNKSNNNENKEKDYSKMTEKELKKEAIKEYLQSKNIKINDDDTITLYHVTSNENYEKIMKEGFKGTDAPIGGMVGEEVDKRVFFGFDKKWVEETWGHGRQKTIEVHIPLEYIRQGGKNDKEVYIEGNITKKGDKWIPDREPTSTFYDRLALKKFKAKHKLN